MKPTTNTQIKHAIACFNRAEICLQNAINNEFQMENEDLVTELENICETTVLVVESLEELIE